MGGTRIYELRGSEGAKRRAWGRVKKIVVIRGKLAAGALAVNDRK